MLRLTAPLCHAVVLAALALGTATASAQDDFYLEPILSETLYRPVDVEAAPGGWLFVALKQGVVVVVSPEGEVLPEPFVDVSAEVLDNLDRGLLGIALHPDWPATPDVYLLFTVDDRTGPAPDPQTLRSFGRVLRFSGTAADPFVADPASRTVLLGEGYADGIPTCFYSHTVGTIAFGHDGSLFVGAGDGASWDSFDAGGLYPECFAPGGIDPAEDVGAYRAQMPSSLAGKILRLDPETGRGLASNPFYTGDPDAPASKVWALGLRNPFRFAVAPLRPGHPAPGRLLIGDVGASTWEEVDAARGGENFGWPCFEGPEPNAAYQDVPPPPGLSCEPAAMPGTLAGPLAYWHHYNGAHSSPAGLQAKSITGGDVYRGGAYPSAYAGALFMADFDQQWVLAARFGPDGEVATVERVASEAGYVVDVEYEPHTEGLVLTDVFTGQLSRLRHRGGGGPPLALPAASPRHAEAGTAVAFDASGSVSPSGAPLTYRWAFGDGAEADGPSPSHVYAEPGTYVATVSVSDPAGRTTSASVRILVVASLPRLSFPEGVASGPVTFGGAYALRAVASDSLGEGVRVRWEGTLVHNEHEHPDVFAVDGPEGVVSIPPHGDIGEAVYYRATATATDEEGASVQRSITLRQAVPWERDVTAAFRPDSEGRAAFGRALAVGMVTLPGLGAVPPGVSVDVRQGGAWAPAEPLQAVVEPEGVRLLFPQVEAEEVRVVGGPVSPRIHARFDDRAGLPAGYESADVGDPERPGLAAPASGSRLVLVGSGALAAGRAHTVRRAVRGAAGRAVVRVDSVAGPGAAGVALTDEHGLAAALGLTATGAAELWVRGARGDVRRMALPDGGGSWLRLDWEGGGVVALRSPDGVAWTEVAPWRPVVGVRAAAMGAFVGGHPGPDGPQASVAWLGGLASSERNAPAVGSLTLDAVHPNPVRQGAAFARLSADAPGRYRVRAIDARGREVLHVASLTVEAPDMRFVRVPVHTLAPGVYTIEVVHAETGRRAYATVTVVD